MELRTRANCDALEIGKKNWAAELAIESAAWNEFCGYD